MESQRPLTSAMQAILEKTREAGIIGAVSGLPTYLRLLSTADVIIANGVSGEPLVRADAHLVAQYPREVVVGLKHAMQATHAKRGFIALKRSDRAAIASISRAIAEDGFAKFHIELRVIDPFFPADDESILMHELGNPQGAIAFSVHTLYHLAEAQRGQSMTMRMVTITGHVRTPKTLWAPIGTSLFSLIEAAGGATFAGTPWLLLGGPLRGRTQEGMDGVLQPETGTIAVLQSEHVLVRRRAGSLERDLRRAQSACNGCARCTELCPSVQQGSALQPHRVMRALQLDLSTSLSIFAATADCKACNLCTLYACTEELAPGRIIAEIRARQGDRSGSVDMLRSKGKTGSRVPLGRLVKRLGLAGLDHLAPLDPLPFQTKRIELSLSSQHHATVRPGDFVSFGQVVARPTHEHKGVPLHTGLAGVVKSLGTTIVISARGCSLEP